MLGDHARKVLYDTKRLEIYIDGRPTDRQRTREGLEGRKLKHMFKVHEHGIIVSYFYISTSATALMCNTSSRCNSSP
jgi:hypothetical protein